MPPLESPLHIPPEFIIHETEHWVLNHHLATALPGYLILGSRAPVDSLADLPIPALHEFGEVLARAQSILQSSLTPERLYVSRYGHSPGYPIHFHLIPVYAWVERLFREDPRYRLLETFATPGNAITDTDGAEMTLFIWREFGESEHPPAIEGPSISHVIDGLRAVFADAAMP